MKSRLVWLVAAVCLAVGSFGSSAVEAGAVSKKQVEVTLPSGTKDIHIQVAGTLTDVKVKGADDPAESEMNGGSYAAGWAANQGGKKVTIDLARKGAGTWNLRIWYTKDGSGKIKDRPEGDPDATFASLCTESFWENTTVVPVFAENPGPSTVSMTDAQAWVISDLAAFESEDWWEAESREPDYEWDDMLLSAGTVVPMLPEISRTGTQWIKVRSFFDGVPSVQAYAPVPEPSSLALGAAGVAALAPWLRRRRKSSGGAS